MDFNEFFQRGYERICEDRESQDHYKKIICKVRAMPQSVLDGSKCVFIPNDTYMIQYFGKEAMDEELGCYFGEKCIWSNCMIFPITNLADRVVGFAGFNPVNYVRAKESGDYTITYYSYSKKSVFNKGAYLYCKNDTYNKALEDGYLCLVDGLFDTLSLAEAGFHAAGLLGSTLTQQILFQLRFVKHVILLADNDLAGIKVYDKLCFHLGDRVTLIKQGAYKDADEVLKSRYRSQFLEVIKETIEGKGATPRCPVVKTQF